MANSKSNIPSHSFIKQGNKICVTPEYEKDRAFINEISLELVNGATKFVDYEPSDQQVSDVVDRFMKRERTGLLIEKEE